MIRIPIPSDSSCDSWWLTDMEGSSIIFLVFVIQDKWPFVLPLCITRGSWGSWIKYFSCGRDVVILRNTVQKPFSFKALPHFPNFPISPFVFLAWGEIFYFIFYLLLPQSLLIYAVVKDRNCAGSIPFDLENYDQKFFLWLSYLRYFVIVTKSS